MKHHITFTYPPPPPGQNVCHFADDIFRCIFMNEMFRILIKTSLNFVPWVPIEPNIGLDNGLAPNRRQATIWTNADLIHWCIYAALGGRELTQGWKNGVEKDEQHFKCSKAVISPTNLFLYIFFIVLIKKKTWTLWGMTKKASMLLTTFWKTFSWKKSVQKFNPKSSFDNKSSLLHAETWTTLAHVPASGDGFAMDRQQVITWTNVDQVRWGHFFWHHYDSIR